MWIQFRVPLQDGVKQPSKVVCEVSGFVSMDFSTAFILQGLALGQVLGDSKRKVDYEQMERWIQGHGALPVTLTSDHLLKMAEFFPMGLTSLVQLFGCTNRVSMSTLANRGELQLTKEMLALLRQAFVKSSRFFQPEMAESAIVFKVGEQYFLNATVLGSAELISLHLEQVGLTTQFPLDFYYP